MHTLLYYCVCVSGMCACVLVCMFVCDMRDRERKLSKIKYSILTPLVFIKGCHLDSVATISAHPFCGKENLKRYDKKNQW